MGREGVKVRRGTLSKCMEGRVLICIGIRYLVTQFHKIDLSTFSGIFALLILRMKM
jgi:hypothetical protein